MSEGPRGGGGSTGLAARVGRVVRVSFGIVLLILGAIGLFLPVLQGVLLLLAGLAVLSADVPLARNLFTRLKERGRKRLP